MKHASPDPARRFSGSLARTMALVLLPLTLLPLVLMSASAYQRTRGLLRSQTFSLLTGLANNQSEQLKTYASSSQVLLATAAAEPVFTNSMRQALEIDNRDDPNFQTLRQQILGVLSGINRQKTTFNNFLVVLPRGEIFIASNPLWEGQSLQGQKYFLQLTTQESSRLFYSFEPLYSGSLVMASTVFYRDRQSQVAATLVGVAESATLANLMRQVSFFSSQTYFILPGGQWIGMASGTNKLVEVQPSAEQALVVKNGLASGTRHGVTELNGVSGVPIVAAYTWMPALEAGWVTELTQERVYGQINSLLPFTLLLMGGMILLLIIILAMGTRTLVRPLLQLAENVQRFAEGRWELRVPVKRKDEIGRLAASFNQMADDLTSLYHALESKVEISARQIHTTAEMADIASTSPSLEVLLRRSSELIRERFDLATVRVYLLDVRGQPALAESSQQPETIPAPQARSASSLVQWVVAQNKQRLDTNPASETPAPQPGANPSLPIRAEAALPIAIGNHVFGALELLANLRSSFTPEVLNELQTLTHSFAVAIQNFHLLEAAQVNLQETNSLYHATSQIAHADSPVEVFTLVEQALQKSPYIYTILVAEPKGLRQAALGGPQIKAGINTATLLSVQPETLKLQFPDTNPVIVQDMDNVTGLLARLVSVPRQLGSQAVALLPVICNGELEAVYTFGAKEKYILNQSTLQPYVNLAEFTATVLEKLQALEMMEKRVRALQTLESLGQAISTDTDLGSLYRLIHDKIVEVMGQVEFLIALYDPQTDRVEIPYAYEGTEPVSFPPFPLGNGLTSIVIRNRKPLLLNEDVAVRSAELGAKVVVGAEARSWLGVPLLLSGEAVGALVVQDIQQEKRFSDEDQRILSTMAAQVAVVIRNVNLLGAARQQAERERLLYDVTSQIRRSADMHAILESTASELGRLLGARRAHITLGVKPGVEDDEKEDLQHIGSVL